MNEPHRTIRPAPIRKVIEVAVPPERAFDVFVSRIDRWWPREKSIGASPQAAAVIEPRVGGRWYEVGQDGAQTDWGRVLAWEPPGRLLLAWQITGAWRFDPDFETEVEVRFHEIAPGRTRVELEHRNLERFGAQAEALLGGFEQGWAAILARYVEATAA